MNKPKNTTANLFDSPCTLKGGLSSLNVATERLQVLVTNAFKDNTQSGQNDWGKSLFGDYVFQGVVINADEKKPVLIEFHLGTLDDHQKHIDKNQLLLEGVHTAIALHKKRPMTIRTHTEYNKKICDFGTPATVYHLLQYGLDKAPDGTAPFDLSMVTPQAVAEFERHLKNIRQNMLQEPNNKIKLTSLTNLSACVQYNADKEIIHLICTVCPDIFNKIIHFYQNISCSKNVINEGSIYNNLSQQHLSQYTPDKISRILKMRNILQDTHLLEKNPNPPEPSYVSLDIPTDITITETPDAYLIKAKVANLTTVFAPTGSLTTEILPSVVLNAKELDKSDIALNQIDHLFQFACGNLPKPKSTNTDDPAIKQKNVQQMADYMKDPSSPMGKFFEQFADDILNNYHRHQEKTQKHQQQYAQEIKKGKQPSEPITGEHISLGFSTLFYRTFNTSDGEIYYPRRYDCPLPDVSFTDFSKDGLRQIALFKHPLYEQSLDTRADLKKEFSDRLKFIEQAYFGDIKKEFFRQDLQTLEGTELDPKFDPSIAGHELDTQPIMREIRQRLRERMGELHQNGFIHHDMNIGAKSKVWQDLLTEIDVSFTDKDFINKKGNPLVKLNDTYYPIVDGHIVRDLTGYTKDDITPHEQHFAPSLSVIAGKQALNDLQIMRFETMAVLLNTPLVHDRLVQAGILDSKEKVCASQYAGVPKSSPMWRMFSTPFGNVPTPQDQEKGWIAHPMAGHTMTSMFDLAGKDLNARNILSIYLKGLEQKNPHLKCPLSQDELNQDRHYSSSTIPTTQRADENPDFALAYAQEQAKQSYRSMQLGISYTTGKSHALNHHFASTQDDRNPSGLNRGSSRKNENYQNRVFRKNFGKRILTNLLSHEMDFSHYAEYQLGKDRQQGIDGAYRRTERLTQGNSRRINPYALSSQKTLHKVLTGAFSPTPPIYRLQLGLSKSNQGFVLTDIADTKVSGTYNESTYLPRNVQTGQTIHTRFANGNPHHIFFTKAHQNQAMLQLTEPRFINQWADIANTVLQEYAPARADFVAQLATIDDTAPMSQGWRSNRSDNVQTQKGLVKTESFGTTNVHFKDLSPAVLDNIGAVGSPVTPNKARLDITSKPVCYGESHYCASSWAYDRTESMDNALNETMKKTLIAQLDPIYPLAPKNQSSGFSKPQPKQAHEPLPVYDLSNPSQDDLDALCGKSDNTQENKDPNKKPNIVTEYVPFHNTRM